MLFLKDLDHLVNSHDLIDKYTLYEMYMHQLIVNDVKRRKMIFIMNYWGSTW